MLADPLLARVAAGGLETVTIPAAGRKVSGSLALPAKAPAAAVLLIHEWWGLNDYARNRAHMLAQAGYTALAVDMYGTGEVATHPKDAKSFMETALADPETMNARFQAARSMMLKQQQVAPGRLFAIGYCFGGAAVLEAARAGFSAALHTNSAIGAVIIAGTALMTALLLRGRPANGAAPAGAPKAVEEQP